MKDTKNTKDDDEYKEDTSIHQYGNERVDNPETSDNFVNGSGNKHNQRRRSIY